MNEIVAPETPTLEINGFNPYRIVEIATQRIDPGNTSDAEKEIARRVARKIEKCLRKGYTAKDIRQYAWQCVVNECQSSSQATPQPKS